MLRRLRLQLTLLYIIVAVGLVALVSIGAYSLLGYYFQRQTDLALGYKMALTFRKYQIPLPAALSQAEADWRKGDTTGLNFASGYAPTATHLDALGKPANSDDGEEEDQNTNDERESDDQRHDEESERYDSQLASIYVLFVNSSGSLIQAPGTLPPPYALDRQAVSSAYARGVDVRTVRTPNQQPVRLLTYRVDSSEGPFFFQAGRSLSDQHRVSAQFLLGLLLLGAVSITGIGVTSWWLSGKSILPAQQSWDQQQTFISNASHELRTPLTLINASAEVLQRAWRASGGEADPEQAELVENILAECDYMNRLVNDLLLLSRLDARRLQLEREPILLEDLTHELLAQAQTLAGKKRIRVLAAPAQGTVLADRQRLRQVLLILLDNAIRHTPAGGEIRLETTRQKRTCQIAVVDNGEGIAPEHLPHIFDRFYQASSTGEGAARSNGLGLSIASGIVSALGGHIQIYSRPGEGTRAVIELPSGDLPPAAP